MEFPDLGNHCSESFCRQIDFLPVKCDACQRIFCKDHFTYSKHSCPSAYKKDVQVPVCPLCSVPVPINKGQVPDIVVSNHIDNDCASDPAVKKRKIYTNRCSKKGCKKKELIKVTCDTCMLNFCLSHRHARDHDCQGPSRRPASTQAGLAALQRMQASKQGTNSSINGGPSGVNSSYANHTMPRQNVQHLTGNSARALQGHLSEDEALAQALQASLSQSNQLSQEEMDRQIAEALAASENMVTEDQTRRNQRTNGVCSVS